MNLKTCITSLLILISTALRCIAQDGTTAYEFLNVTQSSHAYALGGVNLTVIDDDINLVEQNPALLGPEFETQAGLSYMRYLGGSNFMGARFTSPVNDHSAWAAGIQYFGYGSMTAADPDGTVTGTFSPSDIAFTGTFSHDINDNWRGGITMKFVYSSYEAYNAMAICADLGVNYYNPDNDFSFSFVMKNLGGQVKKFNENYNKLPWDIQAGISKSLNNSPIRFSITAIHLNKWKLPYYDRENENSSTSELVKKNSFVSNLFRHLIFAAEYVPSEKFYIGLGYNYKTRTDMVTYARNFLSGFSVGAGLKVKAMGFGVALSQPHIGGTTFMFNLTASISEMMR